MNVLVVEPGFLPYEKEIKGLPDMKKIVGGSIEAIYPFKENVAVGRLAAPPAEHTCPMASTVPVL